MAQSRLQPCRPVLLLLTACLGGAWTPWVDAQTAVLVPAIPPIFPQPRAPVVSGPVDLGPVVSTPAISESTASEPSASEPMVSEGEHLASIRSLEAELPFPRLRSEPLPVAVGPNAGNRSPADRRGTTRLPTVVEVDQNPPSEPIRIAQRPTPPVSEPTPAPTVTPVEPPSTVPSLRPFPEEKPIYEIGLSLKPPKGHCHGTLHKIVFCIKPIRGIDDPGDN